MKFLRDFESLIKKINRLKNNTKNKNLRKAFLSADYNTFKNREYIFANDKISFVLKNNEEILFLMIGDGPERKRIIKKADTLKLNNMKFEQSPYNEMAELYSIAYASIACLKI